MSPRRLLRGLAIGVGVLLLVLAGLLWYGLSSERVARRLIGSALARAGDGIVIGRVSGSIGGPLIVHDVSISRETFAATIDSALLDWTPTGLIRRQVRIDRLHATGVHVTIPDSAPSDSAAPRPRLPMDVILRDVLVRDLSVDAPGDVAVRGASVRLDGQAEDYRFAAEGVVSMPRVDDAQARLAGTGNLDHVVLDSSTATVLEGELRAAGRVGWWPETTWDLRVRGTGVEPALLLERPADWPGSIAFVGQTSGSLDSVGPVGSLAFDSLGGAIRGQPVGGSGAVEFAGMDLQVPRMAVSWGSARLVASGAVADSVSADFQLSVGSLGTALSDAAGTLQIRGTARGQRDSPGIRATFEGRRLRLGANSVGTARGRADVVLAPSGRLNLDLQALDARIGSLPLDSVVVTVRGTQRSHRVAAAGSSAQRRGTMALAGGLSGDAWAGSLRELAVESSAFGRWELEKAAPLRASRGSASVGQSCLLFAGSPGARLCGRGAWLGGESWRAAGIVERLPLALFDALLPDSLLADSQAFAGTLAARLEATSRGGRLEARMSVRADTVAIVYRRATDTMPRRISFDSAAMELAADRSGARGSVTLVAARDDGAALGRLDGTLAVPGFSRLGRPLERERIVGRISGGMDSLHLLGALLPALDSLAGRVALEAEIAGTVGAPTMNGKLSFDSIFVWLPRGRAGQGSVEVTAAGTLAEGNRVTGELTVVPRGVVYDYTLDALPRRVLVDSGAFSAAAGPGGTSARLGVGLSDTAGARIASVSVALTLPQYTALGPPVAPEPMTLRVDAEAPDLAFARALTDRYDSLGGRVVVHAEASGHVGTPQLEGELRVENFVARSATGTLTRGGLLGTLTAAVAPDSSLTGELRLVPRDVRFAYVEGGAFEEIVLDTTALEVRADAGGVRGGLALVFADTAGTSLGTLTGRFALPDLRRYGRPLGAERLEATVEADVGDLAFAEAFSPEIDSLAGSLELDVTMAGTVGEPTWAGGLHLRDAVVRLPLLGALYREMRLDAVGDEQGDVRVDGTAVSGPGRVTLAGTTPLRPTSERPGRLRVSGRDFEAMNTGQLRALVTPELDVTLVGDTIDLRGTVHVPIARMQLTEIPEFAVPPSDDVVFVGDSGAGPTARPIRAEVQLVLGDSVSFSGFNFNAELGGALLVLESPERPTRASGAVIIEQGRYKAYGQDLTVSQGRVSFAGGPVDNPALSIRASRSADDGTVAGLQIGGTLKSPDVTIWSEPSMSQNSALHYIVTGRPPGEGSGADGSLLSRAASSLGLRGTNVLARSLGQGFGLDEARIESEGGFHEASFVAGAYLSPSLYVSYGIGLFDPNSTLRLRYLLSKRWTLQAETGTDTGADLLYRIERGR